MEGLQSDDEGEEETEKDSSDFGTGRHASNSLGSSRVIDGIHDCIHLEDGRNQYDVLELQVEMTDEVGVSATGGLKADSPVPT